MNETGYIAPKVRYVPPVLFNPYTGEPRDARDIASDPHGVLIVPPGAALAAAPQAPAAASALATQVIENLLQLARIVNVAVEDWGETKEDDSLHVIFHKEQADKLEEILEFFDSLPDAPPEEGVILSGPSRAARVLRAMAAPAATAVDAPWGDLKVAFGIGGDADALWAASDAGNVIFPTGWKLVETDGSCARTVAIFRVDHPPTFAEGRAVQAILDVAQAKEGGA